MVTEVDVASPASAGRVTSPFWWVPLILGVGWIVVAMALLQLDIAAVKTISWVLGIVLLAAGLNQLVDVVTGPGWRLLHLVLGVVFVTGGVTAIAWPSPTFLVAAHLLAWYLLLKGVSDVISALVNRDRLEFWGFLLLVGVLEMSVAFWAVGYSGRSSTLLILWVAFGALAKGLTSIIAAFELRPPAAPPTSATPGVAVPAPSRGAEGMRGAVMR